MSDLFPGFETRRIEGTEGVGIHLRLGGRGEGLLLLHGYPQTHAIWHRVAGRLARRHTVVCPDLRGYGDSDKPASTPDHAPYSKRAMAADQVELMRRLGFESFAVVGHDRGGRVAHRMALDHPHRVRRLAVLDICPTRIMYERTDMAFAQAYYHWFFLTQPAPLPETLIGADPRFYLHAKLGGWGSGGLSKFAPDALAEYERCFADPEVVRASCEDYRAAATMDLEHDRADAAAGRRVECPLLALWGERGVVHRLFHPLEDWAEVAGEVTGRALPCGHYIPEEEPERLLGELEPFLGG